ncbi:DNA replication initiation factor cdc45 [Tilletia horrida]|uniref:DNA replication initiation factor cdc45 n=1 Tax=Tilletia horrida TaxID=155126 RepID=A0AAN6GML8_9BASI|nr:DNA replication initiation factor cdc45 [Tilletia horrida]KAK0563026.1 DNA replication initiation factor cdc45 [Tilletia horrida]
MVLYYRPRDAGDEYYSARAKDYTHAYNTIFKAARSRSGSSSQGGSSTAVLLLVAPDIDAICAARILIQLLKDDDIPYHVIPVNGYATLHNVVEEHIVENDNLHTVIMLNLGSVLSLPNYFATRESVHSGDSEGFPLPTNCTVHILDAHRPWNLDNLFATSPVMNRLAVWDDGDVQEQLIGLGDPTDPQTPGYPNAAGIVSKAYEALEFENDEDDDDSSDESSEDDEDEDEDEDDDEDLDEEERAERRRRRTQWGVDLFDEDDDDGAEPRQKKRRKSDDGEDDEGDESERGSPSKKRKGRKKEEDPSKPKRLRREEKERYRLALSKYYTKGTGYGMSVAGMMYLLATKLGRSDNEGLWLAILGLTTQLSTNQMDMETYDEYAVAFASDVTATNPVTSRSGSSLLERSASDPLMSSALSTGASIAADPDDSSIRVLEQELRFILYRHWNLEDAMYHTGYVASKLGTWRDKGRAKMRGMLAKMGVSLAHSRQTYEHMPLSVRKDLFNRTEAIAPEYGMTDLVYRSFIRSFGLRSCPLSAMDSVEGLNALLQAAHGTRIEVDLPGMTFGRTVSASATGGISGIGRGPGGAATAIGSVGGGGVSGAGPGASDLFGAKRVWTLTGSAPNGDASGADKENNPPGAPPRPSVDDAGANTSAGATYWQKNFAAAFHALEPRNGSSVLLLRSSISLAKALQEKVVSEGTRLIQKQEIRTLRTFRLAILRDGPNLPILAHPGTLTRLTLWLVDALRDILTEKHAQREAAKRKRKQADNEDENELGEETGGKGKHDNVPKSLPFVVAALDESRDMFVVVGLTGAPDVGDTRSNKFGLAFQDAASKSGSVTIHDNFETSIVEVKKADFGGFIELLHVHT